MPLAGWLGRIARMRRKRKQMGKPDYIDQRAWVQAGEVTSGIAGPTVDRLRGNIAKALMQAKAEQRESDAKIAGRMWRNDTYIHLSSSPSSRGYDAACGHVAHAIRKGGE